MQPRFEEMLSTGEPRSLGQTEEVVRLVLADRRRLDQLFELLFHSDEIVRMRAGDALEKVCRQQPEWMSPFKERLLTEVSRIAQPSVQWHLAQMLGEIEWSPAETPRVIRLLKKILAGSNDWIVTNLTLESLSVFARKNAKLHQELTEICTSHLNSPYKSIATRCRRILRQLSQNRVS